MAELVHLDRLSKRFADLSASLDEAVKSLRKEVVKLQEEHMPAIKQLSARVADAEMKLRAAVEESPELFERPKTMVLQGVTIGFRKEQDGLDWKADDVLIKRIQAKYPELAPSLIKTEQKLLVKALQQLNDKQLKSLGIARVPGEDQVYIAIAEGDIDKLVDKMVDSIVGAALKESGR